MRSPSSTTRDEAYALASAILRRLNRSTSAFSIPSPAARRSRRSAPWRPRSRRCWPPAPRSLRRNRWRCSRSGSPRRHPLHHAPEPSAHVVHRAGEPLDLARHFAPRWIGRRSPPPNFSAAPMSNPSGRSTERTVQYEVNAPSRARRGTAPRARAGAVRLAAQGRPRVPWTGWSAPGRARARRRGACRTARGPVGHAARLVQARPRSVSAWASHTRLRSAPGWRRSC